MSSGLKSGLPHFTCRYLDELGMVRQEETLLHETVGAAVAAARSILRASFALKGFELWRNGQAVYSEGVRPAPQQRT
jgi:hypothetical protein